MADYNLVCVNCFHNSHIGKECPYCPMPTKENPNSRCTTFVRADLFISRAVARIEESSNGMHAQLMAALSTIFDLLCEAYPAASDSLQEKLKKRQEENEARMKEAEAQRLKEADEALQKAQKEDTMRELEQTYSDPDYEPNKELDAKDYVPKNNLIKFPVKEEEVVSDEPDPEPIATV